VPWHNTTHDWTTAVDAEHLALIRQHPTVFAPGGPLHLILEVIAYAADEAESTTTSGRCVVTLHGDGSVSVSDDGRGTDTRYDDHGQPIKKPIIATKDLRFFDSPTAQRLPDGHPRRGMSTVAALTEWLTHTNRRYNRAWTQRYEHGLEVTDLVPINGDDTTGTTVHFLPDEALRATQPVTAPDLRQLAISPHLSIDVVDSPTDDP